MRLSGALLLVALMAWPVASSAEEEPPSKAIGGGEIHLGTARHRFSLTRFSTAPPAGGLPGALKFEGMLEPERHGAPFRLSLTVLRDGTLYRMSLQRRTASGYPDSWNATLKTRVRLLKQEDRLGGRTEIQCEGPLTGVINQKPAHTSWAGTLWVQLPGVPEA